ncbi:MAG: helix-turn-helix domain-containing protein [Bacteroidetes bacterium]|nr:helix-turn-helix domain-containing protein [Bacteroidota bacterium]
MNDIDYLTTKQAAAVSGLSASYLNKLRSIGGGSPFLKIGRRCLYRRDQFDDWLSQHQRSSTADTGSNAA